MLQPIHMREQEIGSLLIHETSPRGSNFFNGMEGISANRWKTVFSYGRLESFFPGAVRWEWDLDFGGVGGCGSAVKHV